jgi:proteic killer suppression protein
MGIKIVFADRQGLQRAEKDPRFDAGLGPSLWKAYRDKMDFLRSCNTEQDIRAMKALHFEKLKGKRSHQHSIKLKHDGKRLIFQIIGKGNDKYIQIDEVGDYH